jgi:hypothetical protein
VLDSSFCRFNLVRPKKAQMGPHFFIAILKSSVGGFIGSINYVFE